MSKSNKGESMTDKPVRQPISKKTRFEVFKRDKFTCQYCGAKAPEVVLECDHINPVANGGDSGIMNLVTACAGCNNGKGARMLDDRSVVERQRAQVEELQARREQLEMMLQWRDAEQAGTIDEVDAIADRMGDRGGYVPNESGRQSIRRWLKRYSLTEILTAMDEAFDSYMTFDGDEPNRDSWNLAFKKLPAIASLRRQAEERPYVVKIAYIQGILRRRLRQPRVNFFPALEEWITDDGVPVEALEGFAKSCADWDDFCEMANSYRPAPVVAPLPPLHPVYDVVAEQRKAEARSEALRQEREYDAAYNDGFDDDGFDD